MKWNRINRVGHKTPRHLATTWTQFHNPTTRMPWKWYTELNEGRYEVEYKLYSYHKTMVVSWKKILSQKKHITEGKIINTDKRTIRMVYRPELKRNRSGPLRLWWSKKGGTIISFWQDAWSKMTSWAWKIVEFWYKIRNYRCNIPLKVIFIPTMPLADLMKFKKIVEQKIENLIYFERCTHPLSVNRKQKKSVTIGDACPASVCTCIPHAATK